MRPRRSGVFFSAREGFRCKGGGYFGWPEARIRAGRAYGQGPVLVRTFFVFRAPRGCVAATDPSRDGVSTKNKTHFANANVS